MRYPITRILTGVLCAGALALSSAAAANASSPLLPLQGNTVPAVHAAKDLGPVSADMPMRLSVVLRIPNESALQQLIAGLYQKGSANYHQFLSPSQFAAEFSPSVSAYNALQSYFTARGLSVAGTYPNRLVVDLTGTAGQVESALHVALHSYRMSTGHNVYANVGDPMLPANLQPSVAAVLGLDDISVLTPRIAHGRTQIAPSPHLQSGPAGGYGPADIQSPAAYDFTDLYSSGYYGQGSTMAIATAYLFSQSDLSAFDSYYGIGSPSVAVIPVDGSSTQTNIETTLDIEWSSADAPQATYQVYEGSGASLSTFTDVYNTIVSNDTAQTVSTSWGSPESQMPSSSLSADDQIFQQAAAEGQAWFAASGDNGAYDGTSSLTPDFPASDPYVTAVGGTTLTLDSSGNFVNETGWSGSGGGVSAVFAEPTWQTGSGVPQTGYRNEADVSMNADPNTGYSFYYGGQWQVAGGTSFAAPQWSALWAIVDEVDGNLGQADPNIYNLMNSSPTNTPIWDMTSGNNGYYTCTPGWDYVTGWGTPDAYYLVTEL